VAGVSLIGRRFSGGVWSNLTFGARTTTNAQTLNNTNFGDPVAFGDGSGAINLGIQTQPSSVVSAGAVFPAQPVVRIENAAGGLAATDNSTGGDGLTKVPAAARCKARSPRAAVNGLATFTTLSLQVVGVISLNFTAPGLTGTNSGTITVNPGALHHFAFAAVADPNWSAHPSTSPSPPRTPYNNPATNFTGTVDLTTTAGVISPAVSSAFLAAWGHRA